jgi:hypothetical protein
MRDWSTMNDEYHPELAGYDPDEERPARNALRRRAMQVIVVVGILGLILPGIVISITTATNTAQVACGLVVAQEAPDSVAFQPRFELMGVEGPGWYCYAQDFDGTETMVSALGLIPEVPFAPPGTPT